MALCEIVFNTVIHVVILHDENKDIATAELFEISSSVGHACTLFVIQTANSDKVRWCDNKQRFQIPEK